MSSTVAAPASSPVEARDGPYQGLVPFREEDAPYFRGRTREVEIIVANLRSRRTTILYGPSGVGKSSVLGAGLLPRLRALAEQDRRDREASPGDEPARAALAYCILESWRDEPLAALATAMHGAAEEAAGAPLEPWTPGTSLADAVRGWRGSVRRFLVILDQFEDYFLYHPRAEGEFAEALVELMTSPDLPVNVLVSLREDAHARLDRFADDVPELFSHQIRLEHLGRAGAEEAIRGPVEEHNRRHDEHVEVEGALVTALLDGAGGLRVAGTVSAASAGGDERRGEGIEASYLQLVLTRLWQEEVRHPPTRLRAATLERLGGPEAIVAGHVEETLAEPGLTAHEQEVAAALFEHLVTPSRTKFAQSVGDLAGLTRRDPAEIQGVIDKLTDRERRLLRVREPVAGVPDAPSRVEIYHDALATPILAWRDRIVEQAAARRRRRRLVLWGGVTLVIVAGLAALAVTAFVQRQEANRESAAARSQALAASSLSAAGAQPDLGLALALAAVDAKPTVIADAQLRKVVASSPGVRVIDTDDTHARVAVSPDGRSFAAAGADGTVRVWDAATGEVIQTLEGHDGSVLAVAFSPDGRTIASSGRDGTIRIWDPASGDELRSLEGHDGAVFGVAFSPDGGTIASSGKDGTVRIWDTASGDALRTLEGHHGAVRAVAFSPDGGTLASGGADSTVRLWDPASGDARATLSGHSSSVNAVAFSPGGGALASASDDDTVLIWDPSSGAGGEDPLYGHDGDVLDVTFGPGGRTIASAGDDGTVRIWDTASRELLRTLTGHVGSVSGVAFSPDGRTIVTAGDDETMRLWDPAAGYPLRTMGGHNGELFGVASSPDGRTLATAGDDGAVRLWDAASGSERGEPLTGHDGRVYDVAFSPDGGRVASGGEDGTVRIWDPASGDAVRTLDGDGGAVFGVAFSPDGGTLASANENGTVSLWDVDSRYALRTLEGHAAGVNAIAFSPDGGTLASASDDGTVHLWDTYSGEDEVTLTGHVAPVMAVAFSPDGLTLASASVDDTVRLWDPSSERTRWTLAGPEGSVNGVAFSSDGRTVASAGDDGTVRYWDPASGRDLATLADTGHELLGVAFRPDDTLAAVGDDGTLRIYACRACQKPAEIEASARSLRVRDLSPDERDLYGVGG